ncbi:MAG: TipAS antibiotic-recognition domain-containing protein [Rhodoluna sp.]|nr:TipAS antibiotic-recognition domain-containing protein [Rhodoluna sp.]
MFERSSQIQGVNASYTEDQQDQYKAQHDAIANAIAEQKRKGSLYNDVDVQKLIADHYAFIKLFWTPNKQAYKSLALTYVLDPAFEAAYESFEPGLAKYIKSAIEIWADQNLA